MILDRARYYYSRFGRAGLTSAVKAKLTKRAILLTVHRQDLPFPLLLRLHTSDLPTFDQVFGTQEYRFALRRPPEVIIDAGANIGLTSVYFAARYPQARIVAIEPETSNFMLLQTNVAPYPNIVPLNAALWDKNEQLMLVDPGRGNWAFRTQAFSCNDAADSRGVDTVRGMTVDAVMQQLGIDRVDILKIDIEGSEREVFADPSRWLDKVDAMVVELHERYRPGCNRSFSLGTTGFDAKWQQGDNICLARSEGCLIGPG